MISSSRRPLPDTHTTLTTDRHLCPRRDSNPQSQQARGRRPTPLTARDRLPNLLYLANSLATVASDPELYRLLTFQVPNLMSLYRLLTFQVPNLMSLYRLLTFQVPNLMSLYSFLTFQVPNLMSLHRLLTFQVPNLMSLHRFLTFQVPNLMSLYRFLTF